MSAIWSLFEGNRASDRQPNSVENDRTFECVLRSAVFLRCWVATVDCKVIRTMMASTDLPMYARQAADAPAHYRTLPQC